MASLRKHVFSFIQKNIKNSHSQICRQNVVLKTLSVRNYNNTSLEYTKERDPAPLFFNEEVQKLLKDLTRINLEKVFRHKKLETRQLEAPTYKFMTDDELKKTFEEAATKANDMLQMPPVIKVRESIDSILSKDPALQGYDTAKYVFTDITYGVSNRDRVIVVRNPNGDLVHADWDIRHRMNQIYFPLTGRHIQTPLLFQEEHLKSLLERKEYEFILDAACAQFEPDDPEYQKVTSITYQYINDQNDFEKLRSTRHFGPFSFFLTWFKMIDNLLLDLVSTSNIPDANSLIQLYNLLDEKDSVGKDVMLKDNEDISLVEKYISEKSNKKGQLELAMQSYKELLKQKLELECNLKKAHGVV